MGLSCSRSLRIEASTSYTHLFAHTHLSVRNYFRGELE